ncbi:hypothetical protein HK098_001090 [Nowakowskiella sp. JEL0407]|nr:hypothetical protein HK098_001090 [Nowakowskiella sp. JEL0407]
MGALFEWCIINCSHAKLYTVINYLAEGYASCVVGKSNMFRRSDICAPDATQQEIKTGLAKFGKYMNEDNRIAEEILKLGKVHAISTDLAIQTHDSGKTMSIRDCLDRHTRWKRTRKFAVPLVTLIEPFFELVLNGVCGYYGFLWLLGPKVLSEWFSGIQGVDYSPVVCFTWLFWIFHVGCWLCSDIYIARCLDADFRLDGCLPGLREFPFFSWILRELFALPHHLFAIFGNTVNWRGKLLKLRWDGTIAPVDESILMTQEIVEKR